VDSGKCATCMFISGVWEGKRRDHSSCNAQGSHKFTTISKQGQGQQSGTIQQLRWQFPLDDLISGLPVASKWQGVTAYELTLITALCYQTKSRTSADLSLLSQHSFLNVCILRRATACLNMILTMKPKLQITHAIPNHHLHS